MDRKTVDKVAILARLKLSEKEKEQMRKDMEEILNAFGLLKEIDTKNVKPSLHPVESLNVVREDEPDKSLDKKDALKNARQKEDGYFRGPRVV